MSQILALEWNDREARAAVASRHGDRVVIEQAFAIPLPMREEGSAEPDVGRSIAEALAARGIGQLDALTAVGRGSVELRRLQLPAAPDDELPGMVRLRAMLEFNELDENWPLDFVPADDAGKGNRSVLAAAIAPAAMDRIRAVCQQSGLKLQRVLLRSCAAAALLTRTSSRLSSKASIASPSQRGTVQLLVELFSDQADLTAVLDGRVLLPRTVRLSGDVSQPAAMQSLLTEIRLTAAAVQNQFSGRQVAGIVLCGRGEADAAIAREMEKSSGIRAALFDPFAGLDLGPSLREQPPEQPGRFAAVLGMLVTECGHTRHAIDFLHPRQTAAPVNPRKKWALAALAAALLLLGYFVYARLSYGQLNGEVRQLEARAAEADRILRGAGSRNVAAANEIANWADGEVVWLDRLRELSEDFPAAELTAVGHLSLTCQSDRSAAMRYSARPSAAADMLGRMHLEGSAKDSKAVTAMETSLGAHARRLENSKTNDDRSLPPYTLKFRPATVQVGQGSKP